MAAPAPVWGGSVARTAICNEERGQDVVEYALLVALIAVVCMAALQVFSGAITSIWTLISGRLSS